MDKLAIALIKNRKETDKKILELETQIKLLDNNMKEAQKNKDKSKIRFLAHEVFDKVKELKKHRKLSLKEKISFSLLQKTIKTGYI